MRASSSDTEGVSPFPTHIDISVHGKWTTVTALQLNRAALVMRGKWIKVAYIHDEEWLEQEVGDPEACLKVLKEKGFEGQRADIFTFSQRVPATAPKYEYAMEFDSIAVIPTSNYKRWWEKLPQETRKNVRRSQKRGVVITVEQLDDRLVGELMELNNDLAIRQGRRYPHYGKCFDEVKRDHSSFCERSDYICARFQNELIGYAKLVYQGEVASLLQFVTKAAHYDKRPANVLIAKTVELCESKRISHLIYGRYYYGNKRESPLVEFKERNGFMEMLVPRFYVPLTFWGRVCMALRLHRGLLGILPSGVISALVSIRARWYTFFQSKSQSRSRCSSMPERPICDRQMERSNPPAGSSTLARADSSSAAEQFSATAPTRK